MPESESSRHVRMQAKIDQSETNLRHIVGERLVRCTAIAESGEPKDDVDRDLIRAVMAIAVVKCLSAEREDRINKEA